MAEDEKIEELKSEAEAEYRAVAKAIGIEHDFRPLATIYNSPSSIIVASVERYSPEIYERRLFFRHVSERTYRPIPSPNPEIHYHDLITSPALPVIYYSVWRVTKDDRHGGFDGNWLSVERFDLIERTGKSVITTNGLQLPALYARGWVSQLYSVSPDDSAIFCSCGMERPEKGKVTYCTCSIELRSQRITLLSLLEGVWF